jgi:hypothetical protein
VLPQLLHTPTTAPSTPVQATPAAASTFSVEHLLTAAPLCCPRQLPHPHLPQVQVPR